MNPLFIVVIIILVVLAIAGAPNWGYHNYGYVPSISLGGVLIILLILYLLGVFR
jgi:hypothetical protein